MSIGVILPGQGAQFTGMGRAWFDAEPESRRIFEEADSVLGFALTRACWDPDGDVNRTDIAQPGILATSVAILEVLRARELGPFAPGAELAVTAGLSLGEYTALWVAGSLDFADALRLVRLRGEAMQDASEATPSSMTSLMGADEEVATTLAKIGAEHGVCSVANLNAPGQVVVSGELAALDAVEAHAGEHGIKRAVRLSVAGGFHSECMRPAAERLAAALAEIEIRRPAVRFLSNVTGGPLEDPAAIKDALARQVCAPVLWEKSMRWCLENGIVDFIEPGPGNVLSGLMRRISRDADRAATVQGVAEPTDLPG